MPETVVDLSGLATEPIIGKSTVLKVSTNSGDPLIAQQLGLFKHC